MLKDLRLTVWRTQEIHIGAKNPSNVNFAIIKNQVKFIDTVKYFQQSLASLAKSMTDDERENVKRTCRNFIANKLMLLTEENEKWVLDYLCSGKGTIPYQIVKTLDSLEMKPENGHFFAHKDFYSTLSENNISAKTMKMLKKILNY